MATKLFVNLPVKDLDRSRKFFDELGFQFFGMAEDMTSIIISEHTQVMLLTEQRFATYAANDITDPTRSTQAILVLGMESRSAVDDLLDKALDIGARTTNTTAEYPPEIYHRGFIDLDGHQWEAIHLAGS